MTNLLLLTLLALAPTDNFRGADAAGRVNWCISSNLCVRAEFESRIYTNATFVIEMRNGLVNRSSWYRIGEPITAPELWTLDFPGAPERASAAAAGLWTVAAWTNRQTLAVPAPATGEWFYRLRQI